MGENVKRILIASTKGGCGKTTISTNLATAYASMGHVTMICDADKQKSSMRWLKIRPDRTDDILGLNWSKGVIRPHPGTERVIIDAPAAMDKDHVEELVKKADVIVVPVVPSLFDEDASKRFIAKLDDFKRVRKEKASVLIIGNRVRKSARVQKRMDAFFDMIGMEPVTKIRDSQIYPNLAEDGKGLFDLKTKQAAQLAFDWQPLIAAIETAGK